MTKAEVVLWQVLRRQQIRGLKFRRQHPVGPYILDFYCDAIRLCVEVDGSSHDFAARAQHDSRRDAWLKRQKIEVLRIPANAIHQDLESVLQAIIAAAPSASHSLGPRGAKVPQELSPSRSTPKGGG